MNTHDKDQAFTKPMKELFTENSVGDKEGSRHKRMRLLKISDKCAKKFKNHVNEMYDVCHDLFSKDTNFHKDFQMKGKFANRVAEIYAAATLIDRLRLSITRRLKGPDFLLEASNCWLEVTAVSDGDKGSDNTTPKGSLIDHVIMRITSSFSKKSKKIKHYIKEGTVDSSHPVVIYINGFQMEHRLPLHTKGGYPQIVKALLPIDDFVKFNPSTTKGSIESQYRPYVYKKTSDGDEPIGTDYFLKDEHAHISAVIYSYAVLPERAKWGCDFITVHNPKAKNPLPEGFIKCGKEYPTSCTDESFHIGPVIDHKQQNQ